MVLEVDGLSKIVGIVSAAIGKPAIVYGENTSICDLKNYLVYTDVSKFSSWIDQVVLESFMKLLFEPVVQQSNTHQLEDKHVLESSRKQPIEEIIEKSNIGLSLDKTVIERNADQPDDIEDDEASAGQSVLGNTFQMKLLFIIFLSVLF
jgi:hypothetical protein